MEGQPSCQRRAISRGHLETRLLGGMEPQESRGEANAQKQGCKIWSWWIGDGPENAKIRTWSDASMQRKACDCREVWCDRLILLMYTNT